MKQSGLLAKVWFLYLNNLQGRKLCLNIVREVCLFLTDFSQELVQVTATFLRFFNCQTSSWTPQVFLLTSIRANEESSWVLLEDGRVFCSGRGYSRH